MDGWLPIVIGLFMRVSLTGWAAAHFCSRWFARRQKDEAGQTAVIQTADPRKSPTIDHDDRVEILNQELSREGQDLIAKQRLLRLPRGTDALADELRQRIGQEVTHHEANIAALHREIDRLVQSQRRTVARR